jgi:hypothetical protein
MSETPSVKGVAFQAVWDRVTSLVESGRVADDLLELTLGKEGLALLEEKPQPSLWYPMAHADRLTDLVVKVEGAGNPAYAKSLGASGLEPVLSRDSMRSFIEDSMRRKDRAGHALIGLAGLVYSFGQWTYRGEDLRSFEIDLTEAASFPENSAFSASGFMEALVAFVTHEPICVSPLRRAPDHWEFVARPA